MRRNLRTYISLILIALSPTLLAQEVKEPVRPGTILLSAYQTISDAEKLEEEKAFKNAWNKYHQALRYYESLAAAHPAWKPHIVHRRIETTKAAIKRVEPAAQKAFIAAERSGNPLESDGSDARSTGSQRENAGGIYERRPGYIRDLGRARIRSESGRSNPPTGVDCAATGHRASRSHCRDADDATGALSRRSSRASTRDRPLDRAASSPGRSRAGSL
jgi:hypothetical protein